MSFFYAPTSTFIAHPYTQQKLPYDLERDLLPIARVNETVLVLTVSADSANKTVADFVRSARATPKKYNVAAATGLSELNMDAFLKSEKLEANRISYKSIAVGALDLAEDRIQFLLASVAVLQPLINSGKIRIVAIAARKRSPLYKDIPSVVEAGYPSLVVESTVGLYGPKGMPLELRRRIGADVIAALSDPIIAERIGATGQDIIPGGPDDLATTLKQQSVNMTAIAKILGMKKH